MGAGCPFTCSCARLREMVLEQLTQLSTLDDVAEGLGGLARQLRKASPALRAKTIIEAQERLVGLGLKKYKGLVKANLDKGKAKAVIGEQKIQHEFPNSLNWNKLPSETEYKTLKNKKGDIENNVGGVDSVSHGLSFVINKIEEGLVMEDRQAIKLILATAVSHFIRGDDVSPVWLTAIAPPSGGKTELITMLTQHPQVYMLSELTPKTLVSGMSLEDAVGGVDPSLLNRIPDNILAIKDLTTMLSMGKESKEAIFGQLREVFDGQYTKPFGTGQEVIWKGHITLLAGVTQAIDKQWVMMASLGPRFLFLRLKQSDRNSIANRALSMPKGWKMELQDVVGKFFRELPLGDVPILSPAQVNVLVALADLISLGRSLTERDRDGITEVYEAEMPGRIIKQMACLTRALAMLEQREVNDDDLRAIVRVGFDTLPPKRAHIIHKLMSGKSYEMNELADGGNWDWHTLDNGIEDLMALGVVQMQTANDGQHKAYGIHPKMTSNLTALAPYLT